MTTLWQTYSGAL